MAEIFCWSNLQKLFYITLIYHCVVYEKTTGSSICSIPKYTAQIVDNCPTTEEEWFRAAARKNCSAFGGSCIGDYIYHCVINTHINETIEVCALKEIIHLGYCAEFSMSAYRIFPNYMTNCSAFPSNHCPISYSSTDAYKFPGCYELTKKGKKTQELNTTLNTYVKDTIQTNMFMYNEKSAFSVQDTMCTLKRTSLTFLLLLAKQI